MTEALPSLLIGYGDSGETVRLTVDTESSDDLARLVSRFRSGKQRTKTSAQIALDDLLVNLGQLATWPFPNGVTWEPSLAALATDVTKDAQTVSDRLQERPVTGPVSAMDIESRLGDGWKGALTSFQRRDISRLLSLRHGANFSVPGAGKTRVGLAIFQTLRADGDAKRILIVGPKSSFESWQFENEECLVDPLRISVFDKVIDPAADCILINYERLDGALASLGRWLSAQPSLMILDEAHRMKLGAEGTHGAACLALGPRARRRLILTGTPAPNGPKDLENLLGFVWPGHGRQAVSRAVAGGDLAAASQVLRPLFTRTTKEELGLPPVAVSRRDIELTPLHREMYDALLGQYSARAVSSQDDFQALGKITVYLLMAAISPALLAVGTTRYDPLAYQVPPLSVPEGSALMDLMNDLPSYEMSPKYQETLAIVAENAAIGRKTLVWSTFIRSATTLARLLKEFSPALVHGGSEDRQAEIRRFREDPDCMVLISNPATLGEGISLHKDCHDAIYVDRDFAAGRFLQSLDRIHRLGLPAGTETRVTVLTSRGTIDEVVSQRLESKLEFMGTILDDPSVQKLADLDEEPSIGAGLDALDMQALMGYLRGDPR